MAVMKGAALDTKTGSALSAERRQRNLRTAIVLALIALAVYVSFFVMHAHGG